MKIFYFGKEVRDNRGRFAKNTFKRVAVALGTLGVIATVIATDSLSSHTSFQVVEVAKADDSAETIAAGMVGKKIGELKAELINKLAKAENDGGVPCYFDDNKAGTLPKKDKVSCGDMAYKVSTVQRHYKECYDKVLTNEEAVAVALDDVKARDLATCAIFEHGHLGEWSAATPEMFLTVKIINKLHDGNN